MDHIYVTGHRNPDTESIVAAMAYAALRNACGDREYEAACLGHVSDETQIVLDRFGFQLIVLGLQLEICVNFSVISLVLIGAYFQTIFITSNSASEI